MQLVFMSVYLHQQLEQFPKSENKSFLKRHLFNLAKLLGKKMFWQELFIEMKPLFIPIGL